MHAPLYTMGAHRAGYKYTTPFIRKWEYATPHPSVLAHPSISHQSIMWLQPAGDVMVVGYGDYDANTGPLDVIGYDLTTMEPVTLVEDVPTHEFGRARVIDGDVYLPWTDSIGAPTGYTAYVDGQWSSHIVHDTMLLCFDIAKVDGRLMMCGNISIGGGKAVGLVVTKVDGVWTETLRGNIEDTWSRFYGFIERPDGGYGVENLLSDGEEYFDTTDGIEWIPAPDSEPSWVGSGPQYGEYDELFWDALMEVGTIPLSSTQYDGWSWVGLGSGIVIRSRNPAAPK